MINAAVQNSSRKPQHHPVEAFGGFDVDRMTRAEIDSPNLRVRPFDLIPDRPKPAFIAEVGLR